MLILVVVLAAGVSALGGGIDGAGWAAAAALVASVVAGTVLLLRTRRDGSVVRVRIRVLAVRCVLAVVSLGSLVLPAGMAAQGDARSLAWAVVQVVLFAAALSAMLASSRSRRAGGLERTIPLLVFGCGAAVCAATGAGLVGGALFLREPWAGLAFLAGCLAVGWRISVDSDTRRGSGRS